ncbi:glutamate ABC transporter substrate-binding protein [Streptomyces sp. NBC_01198]|uniref:glutamate ABC transporter substrate-binding protein n=1 Tax=Streptomyces sp. NBC_01198 TaxID=2903769 RepID=UPI002E14974C|nr:glutamate ABC transporter substrate-binding protein [Streptomyces sp. NBC_01198]
MTPTRRGPRPLPALLLGPVLLALLLAPTGGCGRPGSPPAKGPRAGDLAAYRVEPAVSLPASPTWTRAHRRGRLVVGVKDDQPYLGERDPATGAYSGFDIEIARMAAASLGFPAGRITFKAIASANRETSLSNGQIDLYVGTYTINALRRRQVGFAGPYYLAGQGLLVRRGERDIHGPRDLSGRKVCSAAGSSSIQRIEADYPDAKPVTYDTYSVCVDNLLTYQVDAVTTDDSILLGYAAKAPGELKTVGRPFSREPYGIGLSKGDSALRLALDDALVAHERNGDWKRAYDATLGLSGVPAPAPPPVDRD